MSRQPTGLSRNPTLEQGPRVQAQYRVRIVDNDYNNSDDPIGPDEFRDAVFNLQANIFSSFLININDYPGGFRQILDLLPYHGYLYIEFSSGHRFPLNNYNRISLMYALSAADAIRGDDEGIGSDIQIAVNSLNQNPFIRIGLLQLDRRAAYDRYNNRSNRAAGRLRQLISQGYISAEGGSRFRTRPTGAFFPYYVSIFDQKKYNLKWNEQYGIHNDQKDLLEEPCLYLALKIQGLNSTKLEKLKTILLTKYIPRCALGDICRRLEIGIRLRLVDPEGLKRKKDRKRKRSPEEKAYVKESCKYYPGGSTVKQNAYRNWKYYNIGLCVPFKHYFSHDTNTGITKAALNQIIRRKKLPSRWNPMKKATNGKVIPLCSAKLFQILYEEKDLLLKKIPVTKSLLRHITYDPKKPKVYETLEYLETDVMKYGEYPENKLTQKWGHSKKKNNDYEDDNAEKDRKTYITFAGDFEATTDGKTHEAYCFVLKAIPDMEFSNPEDAMFHRFIIKKGKNCAYEAMCEIYDSFYDPAIHEGIRIIFHNASYDVRLLFSIFSQGNPPKIIENCGRLKSMTATFQSNKGNVKGFAKVLINDSYAFISTALSKFPKMFKLGRIKKEIMPYHLYNSRVVFKDDGSLNEQIKYLDFLRACKSHLQLRQTELKYAVAQNLQDAKEDLLQRNLDKDLEAVKDNLRKWNIVRNIEDGDNPYINFIKYSVEYCKRDVELLAQAWVKFRTLCYDGLGINIDVTKSNSPYISINQVAHDYLKAENVFQDNMFWLSGVPRDFIQNCVVGGKTMMANNKPQYVKGPIADLDACSLYPSAIMALKGYLKGKPKVIPKDVKYPLAEWDGYFIRIKVLGFGIKEGKSKSRRFPVLNYVDSVGKRVYSDSDDIIGKIIFIDKITLEDCQKYYNNQFTFELLQGYYYNEGRNENIAKVVRKLYDDRRVFKKDKNPLQLVYKLILNGLYGRSILKPPMVDTVFKKDISKQSRKSEEEKEKAYESFNQFLKNHFYHINTIIEMPEESAYSYRIDLRKDLNEHFNAPHIGVEILSSARSIMLRVMCLAEDLNIPIYYQDTDSMHLPFKMMDKIADEYKLRYSSDFPFLIGNDMLQFHNDFELKQWNPEYKMPEYESNQVHSTHLIVVGKKAYYDKLLVKPKLPGLPPIISEHFRLKGVPGSSILEYCIKEKISLQELYESLYEGNEHTFDLMAGGRARFKMNKDYTMHTLEGFYRRIKFTYDEYAPKAFH